VIEGDREVEEEERMKRKGQSRGDAKKYNQAERLPAAEVSRSWGGG
jgi:hypothetical protein